MATEILTTTTTTTTTTTSTTTTTTTTTTTIILLYFVTRRGFQSYPFYIYSSITSNFPHAVDTADNASCWFSPFNYIWYITAYIVW